MKRVLYVILILVGVFFLGLLLTRCLANDPTVVVTTTTAASTSTTRGTPTTVTTPDPARAKYLANVKALKVKLDKAKGSLKARLAAVKGCHAALNRVKPPTEMVGFHARSACVAAGGARAHFAAAIRYTNQKDRAGRAAVAKHTKAGLRYLATARAEFAKALR